jgi:hypothetical protein
MPRMLCERIVKGVKYFGDYFVLGFVAATSGCVIGF